MSVKSKLNLKYKSNQKSVKMDTETQQKLKIIVKALNQKQSRFLKRLIDEIFNVCGTYETANVSYYPSITGSYVMVQFTGRNRLIIASNKEFDTSVLEVKIPTKLAKKRKERVVA